jgi:hypothetical protein
MGMSFHLFCRMPLKYIGSAKYCRSATSFGFEATFGDYNWHGLQGAINIPIVDGKLASGCTPVNPRAVVGGSLKSLSAQRELAP